MIDLKGATCIRCERRYCECLRRQKDWLMTPIEDMKNDHYYSEVIRMGGTEAKEQTR